MIFWPVVVCLCLLVIAELLRPRPSGGSVGDLDLPGRRGRDVAPFDDRTMGLDDENPYKHREG